MVGPDPSTRLGSVDTTIPIHDHYNRSNSPETMCHMLQATELLVEVKPTALTDDTTAADIVKLSVRSSDIRLETLFK